MLWRLLRIQKLRSEVEKTFILDNNRWRGQAIGIIRQSPIMMD